MIRSISELRRRLHRARRGADRLATNAGPSLLADAIDALPDRTLLASLPDDYRVPIEATLDQAISQGWIP